MIDLKEYQLILASQSPQRSQILGDAGYVFKILPSQIQEQLDSDLDCAQNTLKLAFDKAMSSFNQMLKANELQGKYLFVGSDSIVYYNDKIYGKPKSRNDAFDMLSTLSGTTHQVITSVCILAVDSTLAYKCGAKLPLSESYSIKQVNSFDRTFVTFKILSANQINNWLDKNQFLDKAGSYAIQGGAQSFVERVEGDINNVVGFPLHLFESLLEGLI